MTFSPPPNRDPLRSVVIVGGGTAGWMAASVLSKAFGPALSITLIESEEIGIVGVGEATIPQIRHINNFLEIDENAFLKATNGTFKLGIQFNDWGRLGDSYMHAFGDIGMALGLTPFHHYWLRAVAAGKGGSLWDYSVNHQIAIRDRFAIMERIGSSRLTGTRHAFHFDASLYARFLRGRAEAAGVRRVEGKIVEVRRRAADGFIEGVTLEGGARIDGEFFIDCSGFRGLLIEGALAAGYEDWTHWLPCDRAVAAPCAHGAAIRPYTQASARKSGWQWAIPLQNRVGNGHVYCSRHISDDEAAAVLKENLEGELLGEPRLLRFVTGMRKRQWVKNCVSLGLASGFLEPLESTSIHLIQSGVSRLVSMFPDRHFDAALIDEFNRQSRFEFERIRDFIILHYHANERTDSPFWIERREMAVPEVLAAKLDLFRSTGRIYREHEELFTEQGWLQVMIGQRIAPLRYHPLADGLSESQLDEFLANIRTLIDRAAAAAPGHADYVKANCAA
ncbi:MAG TPA: tryptophan halogenase [Parvularcula sp.]|nr:tryptophan halogenase [Parvularcula sp.]